MAGNSRPKITLDILANAGKARKEIDKLHGQIQSKFSKISGVAKGLGVAMLGATAGAVALTKTLVTSGETAGTSNARIGQVAKSMGLFGNQTQQVTDRLVKLANVTARQTGVDQNQIKLTQAKLMSFKELAITAGKVGDHFDRATKAAVDMGAAGFGTAEQNAVQLGKALNDPIKGITALARSGVTFTQAEKDKIKTLVESNKMHEAQGLVLSAIEKQVGGVALATANGTDKMKVAWSQVKEKLGQQLVPLVDKLASFINAKVMPAFDRWAETSGKKLGPALEKVGAFLATSVFPTLSALFPIVVQIGRATAPVIQQISTVAVPALKALGNIIAGHPALFATIATAVTAVAGGIALFSKGLKAASIAAKAYSVVQGILNAVMSANPIMIVVVAIAALVAAFIYAWNNCKTFRDTLIGAWNAIKSATITVWNAIKDFFTAVWNIIKAIFIGYLTFIVNYWKTVWTIIQTVFTVTWNAIKAFATTAWNLFKTGFSVFLNFLNNLWKKTWNAIKALFTAVWNAIKSFAISVWNAIKKFFMNWMKATQAFWEKTWNAIKNFFITAWNTMKQVFTSVMNTMRNLVKTTMSKIVAFFKGAWNTAKKIVTDAWNAVVKSIRTGINNAVKWVSGLGRRVRSAIGNLGNLLLGPGKALLDGFLRGIAKGWEAVKKKVSGFAGWIASHKGPIEYDRVLLEPAGKAIMDGLMNGIESKRVTLRNQLNSLSNDISSNTFKSPGFELGALRGSYSMQKNHQPEIHITVNALTPTMEVGRVVAEALERYTEANGRGA
ncbi:hypothetical protein [uncultured Mobiluncus sp.]|uniref:phage tail protein n=1 Tax=uncultured Mobiluncus sp. TaxID=293425 RepID=UPI00261F7C86|nr:hypothetical protein [uncultured Mobiluncus sp.]